MPYTINYVKISDIPASQARGSGAKYPELRNKMLTLGAGEVMKITCENKKELESLYSCSANYAHTFNKHSRSGLVLKALRRVDGIYVVARVTDPMQPHNN